MVIRSTPETRAPSSGNRPPKEPPIKHVIDEYKHRAQTVTCVCGWHGSTMALDKGPSEWGRHVAANRNPR